MPRLTLYHAAGWSEPIDYCRSCYPRTLRAAQGRWPNIGGSIDLDSEHPEYDLDIYECETCGRALTEVDA